MRPGSLLEGGLSRPGLTHVEIGKAGEVLSIGADLEPAIAVGDVDEMRVRSLGAFCGGLVGRLAGRHWLAGLKQRRIVNIHALAEGDFRAGRTRVVNEDAGDDQRQYNNCRNGDPYNIGAMELHPAEAGGRGFNKAVLL